MLRGKCGKMMFDLSFYKGKKVFVTGHTGFKGSWLSRILIKSGAILTGYSMEPPTEPSLFKLAGIGNEMRLFRGNGGCFSSAIPVFMLIKWPLIFGWEV